VTEAEEGYLNIVLEEVDDLLRPQSGLLTVQVPDLIPAVDFCDALPEMECIMLEKSILDTLQKYGCYSKKFLQEYLSESQLEYLNIRFLKYACYFIEQDRLMEFEKFLYWEKNEPANQLCSLFSKQDSNEEILEFLGIDFSTDSSGKLISDFIPPWFNAFRLEKNIDRGVETCSLFVHTLDCKLILSAFSEFTVNESESDELVESAKMEKESDIQDQYLIEHNLNQLKIVYAGEKYYFYCKSDVYAKFLMYLVMNPYRKMLFDKYSTTYHSANFKKLDEICESAEKQSVTRPPSRSDFDTVEEHKSQIDCLEHDLEMMEEPEPEIIEKVEQEIQRHRNCINQLEHAPVTNLGEAFYKYFMRLKKIIKDQHQKCPLYLSLENSFRITKRVCSYEPENCPDWSVKN
jgi:hypothetical protein